MVLEKLLSPEVQWFIATHTNSDPAELALRGKVFTGIETTDLIQQVQGRKKAEKKLPRWFKTQGILYPPLENLSQASSQKTAEFKAQLVSGKTLIDITGGFGIDDYFFAQKMEKVIHCEQQPLLSALASHNFKQLSSIKNTEFYVGDGIEFLSKFKGKADWIYADPGRRSPSGNRVYKLEDCEPNLLPHLDLLREKAKYILIKTSPLLDLNRGIKQFESVESIIVVAVKNEVKELLWILGDTPEKNPKIATINFTTHGKQEFEASLKEEKQAIERLGEPLEFLYEPNAALLKAGFFKLLSEHYALLKLATHTHLYTSHKKMDFPGRVFRIKEKLKVQKKDLKKIGLQKANITTRNFPMSVQQIRQKFKWKDGGKDYLFFTQNQKNEKFVLWCEKIKQT